MQWMLATKFAYRFFNHIDFLFLGIVSLIILSDDVKNDIS